MPAPPAATTGPAIVGQPRRGAALTVSTGSWINRPSNFGYQWQRLTARGWRDIAGATRSRYTPGAADLGRRRRATVVALNGDGGAGSTSGQTAPVSAIALNRAKKIQTKSAKARRNARKAR